MCLFDVLITCFDVHVLTINIFPADKAAGLNFKTYVGFVKIWLSGIYVPAKMTLEDTGTNSCVLEDFNGFLKYYLLDC